ncbi:MAG: ArsC family reductase [Sphingomonadales bacterium]|nr:ArsC family reductase [Sphingomonadales bacterium]
MAVTLYGIPNCDTVKKARKWLDVNAVAYDFHDYKKAGVPADALAAWVDARGWETLLNRRGTTFRKLSDADKEDLDAARAIRLMMAHPSTIKRPVVETATGDPIVGFDEDEWARRLG